MTVIREDTNDSSSCNVCYSRSYPRCRDIRPYRIFDSGTSPNKFSNHLRYYDDTLRNLSHHNGNGKEAHVNDKEK